MSVKDRMIDSSGSLASKFDSPHYIVVRKAAFITLISMIIVGVFSVLIFINMVMDSKKGLARFAFFASLAVLKLITPSVNYALLSFLTTDTVFLIGIELGRLNGPHTLFRKRLTKAVLTIMQQID